MPSVGVVLVQYCSSMESKCWLETDLGIYAARWNGTGVVLPQYGVKCWLEADLGIYADRWHGTGSVLPQYGVQMLARRRLRDLCRVLARYWFSTAPLWSPNAS